MEEFQEGWDRAGNSCCLSSFNAMATGGGSATCRRPYCLARETQPGAHSRADLLDGLGRRHIPSRQKASIQNLPFLNLVALATKGSRTKMPSHGSSFGTGKKAAGGGSATCRVLLPREKNSRRKELTGRNLNILLSGRSNHISPSEY